MHFFQVQFELPKIELIIHLRVIIVFDNRVRLAELTPIEQNLLGIRTRNAFR